VLGCVGAFGSGPFGSVPFGSGSSVSLFAARQVALNAVRVTFVVAPAISDPAVAWDALNAENWRLEARDPAAAIVRLAQWVEKVDEAQVDVFFDGPLSAPAIYRIVASDLRTPSGSPIALVQDCRQADFATFPPYRVPPNRARPDVRTDLANPQTLSDEKVTNPLGTFQINDRGDYGLESGRPYLRKRILRRATSAFASFFHLPEYGFEQPLKGVIKPSLQRALQARAMGQIMREPDVARASVEVFTLPDHPEILVLAIAVVDTNGQADQMTVPVSFAG